MHTAAVLSLLFFDKKPNGKGGSNFHQRSAQTITSTSYNQRSIVITIMGDRVHQEESVTLTPIQVFPHPL